VAILDLVSASINSQPGMMELFLCVRPRRDGNSMTEKGGTPTVSEKVSPFYLERLQRHKGQIPIK
jgi:hypothetical protein